MRNCERRATPRRLCGFTYLGALFLTAVLGAGLAATSLIESRVMQREREQELIFIGQQFTNAIGQYYQRSPGAQKLYPRTLEDLLLDTRYISTLRHLRRLYPDPFTGKPAWGPVAAPDGGIMGVHSLAARKPLKSGGFQGDLAPLNGAQTYADWKFVYRPQLESPVAR